MIKNHYYFLKALLIKIYEIECEPFVMRLLPLESSFGVKITLKIRLKLLVEAEL